MTCCAEALQFDPHTVRHGHGLNNMSDRLTAVGGSLTLDSDPGRGTRIRGRL